MRYNNIFIIFGLSFLFACATERDHLVTIETRHGNIYALLYDEAPAHKENFIRLAENGRYDSTEFHRIIQDFMIQGGDVFAKENLPPEEWYTIPEEINNDLFHEKGSIAAARQGDAINPERRSSGSQFYIVLGKVYEPQELSTNMELLQESFMKFLQLKSNAELKEQYGRLYEEGNYDAMSTLMLEQKEEMETFFNINLGKNISSQQIEAYTSIGGTPHLDEGYTVFGKVIEGMEVIETIASESTNNQDQPLNPVFMKVTVKEMSKKAISKAHGYRYPNINE